MNGGKSVPNLSANLKQALCWISEMLREHPEISRDELLCQAELRFDLAPRECEFLDQNFRELTSGNIC